MIPGILETNTQNLAHIDLFSKLLASRIIFLDKVVTDQMVSEIQAQLLYLSSISTDDITIYINTPGGSVYAGLAIRDTMEHIKKTCDIATICTGMAASMGAVLLAGGTKGKRAALKHSRVMIHQPMGGVEGQVSDIKITYTEIEKLKKELYDLLVEDSGQSYEKIEKDSDRDYWMTSQEAVEYGMIDKILM